MFENATSYSDLSTLQRCARRFKYRVIDNLESVTPNRPLETGTLVHKLLAARYTQNAQAIVDLEDQVNEWMLDWDNHQVAVAAWNEAVRLMELYAQKWQDNWEILHCEEEFYVTLMNGMVVRVTPDLVIRDLDTNQVWIVDHKTTSSYSEERREPDLQTYLYFEAVSALYPECAGFMYNQMRTKIPTQPSLIKDRTRVSDLNRIDTTFELLYEFVANEAPHLFDTDAVKLRLAELKAKDRFFWRDWIPLTHSDAVLEDVEAITELLKFTLEQDKFPRTFLHGAGYQACNRCPFWILCQLELREADNVDHARDVFYQERDKR
jgi:hypothetical protein